MFSDKSPPAFPVGFAERENQMCQEKAHKGKRRTLCEEIKFRFQIVFQANMVYPNGREKFPRESVNTPSEFLLQVIFLPQ